MPERSCRAGEASACFPAPSNPLTSRWRTWGPGSVFPAEAKRQHSLVFISPAYSPSIPIASWADQAVGLRPREDRDTGDCLNQPKQRPSHCLVSQVCLSVHSRLGVKGGKCAREGAWLNETVQILRWATNFSDQPSAKIS
ncbi:hypothetical protein HJG60_011887 [Phyllostomus discolor]|uniref:Uncharacterized protein n=1 Tax=Phyllostomus discolor TaxID=89673 RepID=A0A834DYF4_9CHIR|nr:hypothetical protein HJG60_011887 [Phyllostomus discolor]